MSWALLLICSLLLCVLGSLTAQAASPHSAVGSAAASTAPEGATKASPGLWNRVVRCFVIVSVCVVLVAAGLLLFEDRFLFHPTKQPRVNWLPEGLGAAECTFRARDGLQLYGWWHPGEGADGVDERPVLLWFHGNAGNVTDREDDMRALVRQGLAVFMFDYRGYGRSEGRPSEVGLYMDGEAAYRYLTGGLGVAPERIVCLGRSLGAAVAVHVALRAVPAGLIMESPFQSVAAMVRKTAALRVLVPFLRNRFDNAERVRRLKVPLLVVHGAEDEMVPLTQGRFVYEAAHQPKEFFLIEGAGHDDTLRVGGQAYCDRIADFCRRCVAERQEARHA